MQDKDWDSKEQDIDDAHEMFEKIVSDKKSKAPKWMEADPSFQKRNRRIREQKQAKRKNRHYD